MLFLCISASGSLSTEQIIVQINLFPQIPPHVRNTCFVCIIYLQIRLYSEGCLEILEPCLKKYE